MERDLHRWKHDPEIEALIQRYGTPTCMTTTVTIPASGGTAVANNSDLTVPFRQAFVLDEVRFVLRATTDNDIRLSSMVGVKLSLGQSEINRVITPVWLHGQTIDDAAPTITDFDAVEEFRFDQVNWHLPRPLYLPPGDTMKADFQALSNILGALAQPIVVELGYVGWTLGSNAPKPRVRHVPYVTPFLPTVGVANVESDAYILGNPYRDRDLHVQMLTGRLLEPLSASAGQSTDAGTRYGLDSLETPSRTTFLQMKDSYGYDVVKDPTPFYVVFDLPRSSWIFQRTLKPKEWYVAKLTNIYTVGAGIVPQMALIGCREEPVR